MYLTALQKDIFCKYKKVFSSSEKKVAQRHGFRSQTVMILTMFVAYTKSPDSGTHAVTKKIMSLKYT